MANKVLKVEARTEMGSGASRRARAEGSIPAVIYGHEEPRHVLVNRREFNATFKHLNESEIITLEMGKDKVEVLIKDYQSNITMGELVHIDFFEIEKGKVLKTHVALHVEGTAIGVRNGGILEAPLHELEIECLPKDLPEVIVVDVTDLDGSTAIHVRDIEAPAGVKILTNGDQVVASVTHAKAETASGEEGEEDNEEAAASEE